MPTISFSDLSVAWNVASALALSALGITCVRGGKARPTGAFAFGLFAILWGIEIALGNLSGLFSSDIATSLLLASIVASLPIPYLLLEFATAQIEGGPRARIWFVLKLAAGASALLAAVLFIVFPDSILLGIVRYASGAPRADWGPLHIPLIVAPFFLAFAAVLVALHQAKRRAPTPRVASRVVALIAGLGLYVGFMAGWGLAFDASWWLATSSAESAALTLLFGALAVYALYVAGALLADARNARTPDEARRDKLAAAALLIPLAWGLVEGSLASGPLPLLNTVGVWRLAGVAVLSYGIVRWRVFDLPLRTRRAAVESAGVTLAVASGAITFGAAGSTMGGTALPGALGVLVVGATLVPSLRFSRRLFGRRPQENERLDETLYAHRVESYRAALEASLARGEPERDEEFLVALRERFSISSDEDRLLRYYARSAVFSVLKADAGARYEYLRALGRGAAGRTWLARDRSRDQLVVVKEPLRPRASDALTRDAFLREARLAARVRHPNVVHVEEVVERGEDILIVMEYVDGGSLEDVLAARRVLPWREATALTLGMLRGLAAIHAAGVVHRDVKPSNVLLSQTGQPKIADFGIAARMSNGTAVEPSMERAGTAAYMAPESLSGAVPGSQQADVYSCAVVLHECIFGKPPTPGSVPGPVPGAPTAFTAALATGLAPDPAARHRTAAAFAKALLAAEEPAV